MVCLYSKQLSCQLVQEIKLTTHQRDRHLTFEDPKANIGDSGSSMRSTQEWLDVMQGVKDFIPSLHRRETDPYSSDNLGGMSPSLNNPPRTADSQDPHRHEMQRNMLRKEPAQEDDFSKGRKRFSRRHSKNGLAAVF